MPNRSIERTPNWLRRWVAALELVDSAIEWLAVVINAWNRIAISSRYPVNA